MSKPDTAAVAAFKFLNSREISSLCLAVLGLVVSMVLHSTGHSVFLEWRLGAYALIALLFFSGAISPLIRYATSDRPSVRRVCAISVALFAGLMLVLYTLYFLAVPEVGTQLPVGFDKLLNLPPVIAAAWAAAMGWYVHSHASQKNHRIANAFQLCIQTRTSSEYQKRLNVVQRNWPHGTKLTCTDSDYAPDAIKRITDKLLDEKAKNPPNSLTLAQLRADLRRARAVDAMKYLLNYFEFMAVGIEKKEVDEELLYDALACNVASVWDRASPYVQYMQDPRRGNQPLAFSSLKTLVEKWNKRIHQEMTPGA